MKKFVFKTDFPIRLMKRSINAYLINFLIKIYIVHRIPGLYDKGRSSMHMIEMFYSFYVL